ncbi:MAG: NUDIX hydrolase [Myxococcota bacterium]
MPEERTLDAVAARLSARPPRILDGDVRLRAAVSLVLCEAAEDLQLLMIRRAEHADDRWSGHIAFPGGRLDDTDPGERAAAEREAREELGLALSGARRLGRLDDLGGSSESVRVSAFVYGLESPPPLRPNHEVHSAFWLELGTLQDPARHLERRFEYLDGWLDLPALRVLDAEGPVLWGLSYRFLELLMERIGRPIPPMPWRDDL